MSLGDVFHTALLMELASPRVYPRGVSYHRDGRVELDERSDRRVRATVRGTVPYVVELWVDHGEPGWSCTCPAAEDGSFCKHCVAVALVFCQERDGDGASPGAVPNLVAVPDSGEEEPDLTGYVDGLDRDRLEELVLEAIESDWRLRERLHAEARSARGAGPELGTWRRRIDAAFAPYDDFVEYREAGGWASEVSEVIDALEDLCDVGHPDAVVLLAEHAHRRADEAVQYVDDSDGWLTGISERLGEMHLRAAVEGSTDPIELAGRLADLELTSELDAFRRAAAVYADVLGEEGLAEYRRLVEPRWRRVASHADTWSTERFRVREAMIGVTLAGGDPDELIAVHRHDLRTPGDYLEVAQALADADRVDEAIDWARRGLEKFAERPWQTPPLREFLAGLLRDRDDASGALELFWDAFVQSPSLETYRRLIEEAGEDTASWKQRALGNLRSRASEKRPEDRTRRSALTSTPVDSLVEILAFEGDVEAAWEVASEYGCNDRMLLTLARAREDDHPLDAVDVYESEVFAQIDRKKNHAYRAAVDLLARVRGLADAAGEPERFDDLLQRVRTQHKAKRNLKALLDAKGW